MSRVLVIKLGALGDFIMAQPVFNALREHHRNDELCLLTIAPMREMAVRCGLFDRIALDPRARGPLGYWRMRRWFRREAFQRVYDLQGNARTGRYWRLLFPRRPQWAGPVRGCSHPRPPRPPGAHRTQWYRAQLAALGIVSGFTANGAWLDEDISRFKLPPRFILMAAGASVHRPEKRWPAARYVEFARALNVENVTSVLLGTAADAEVNAEISRAVPDVIDLTGQTSEFTIGGLARAAQGAIGNDTGPMHITAFVGCPTLVLFSSASDPEFIGPRGGRTTFLRCPNLSELATGEVLAAAKPLCGL